MIIGIDFDGVLTDLAKFFYEEGEKFAKENKIKICKNESGYNTLEYFGWTKDDDIKFWSTNNLKYTKFVNAKESAKEVLQKLKDEGHKIIIITARYGCDWDNDYGKEQRKISEEWLKRNEISYDEICYVGETSKVSTIIDKEIDIFIDDSVKNLEEVSKIVPVICFDEQYNRNYENPKMKRLSSWDDIYDYLNDEICKGENCENT